MYCEVQNSVSVFDKTDSMLILFISMQISVTFLYIIIIALVMYSLTNHKTYSLVKYVENLVAVILFK